MPDILKDYFEALERLKKGKPTNVPKGTRITNDSVSLEAGRKKLLGLPADAMTRTLDPALYTPARFG